MSRDGHGDGGLLRRGPLERGQPDFYPGDIDFILPGYK
jgi:hypothetical protein